MLIKFVSEKRNVRFGSDDTTKFLNSLPPTLAWQCSESTTLGERLDNHTSVKKHNTSSSSWPIPGKMTRQHYISVFLSSRCHSNNRSHTLTAYFSHFTDRKTYLGSVSSPVHSPSGWMTAQLNNRNRAVFFSITLYLLIPLPYLMYCQQAGFLTSLC